MKKSCILLLLSVAILFTQGAQAEGVSLYGIALDGALAMPSCVTNKLGDMEVYDEMRNTSDCVMPSFTLPGRDFGGQWMEIHYVIGHAPDILSGGQISVWLFDRKIQDIMILTPGVDVQDTVLAQLTAKFGKPSKQYTSLSQNAYGAQFHVVHARWTFSAANIRFDSAMDRFDSGEIEAQTALGADMRGKEAAAISSSRPHM